MLECVFAMPANILHSENELAEQTVAWLRGRLPASWEISRRSEADVHRIPAHASNTSIEIRGPSGTFATMVIEAKRSFGPRDVERLLGGLGRTLRTIAGDIPILVAAPWLSKRSQELLRAEGMNYLDLTGNAFVRLENPALFIETHGAARDPAPLQRGKAKVQGPKAGRLVRLLADARPPYGVRELAATAGLTPGYVSRLLDALDDEALIERTSRGRVESVEVARLLRRWAETYDVFRSNAAARYLAPAGASGLPPRIASTSLRAVVTGSFAAARLAPVAGSALFAAYTDSPNDLAAELDLIPTDDGANVVLLAPFDPVVWERTSVEAGIAYVAPSQVAVDCLTGNGRMPAEGEAVLHWMAADEGRWRLAQLPPTPKRSS
jgi:hypothetical protein